MSSTVTTGKADPYGLPVLGSMLFGPVEPKQPPTLFTPMTKNFSVGLRQLRRQRPREIRFDGCGHFFFSVAAARTCNLTA